MRTLRNYYEILGLPRDATLAQIKRRYKQLVRKYHPDVAADKQTAHRLFLQIREAYETLGDSVRRRDYDASLDGERARATAPSYRPSSAPREGVTPGSEVARLLKDAQWAFIQHRFQEAANHCKAALRIDGRNARAYSILGDIYRAQGKTNTAVRYYSYALQYNPADRESEKKLMNLVGRKIGLDRRPAANTARPASSMTLNMVWWGIAFFLIMLIGVHPGEPIPRLGYYIPQVSKWSSNLVGLIAGASAIVGMLLSINGLVSHPDEELVFDSSGSNWAVIPTGFLLLVGSGFFFPGAAAFYIAAGLVQNSLSKSVLTCFVGVVGVVLLSALVYQPDARYQVIMFGGNVSFLSMLIGWYVGSAFKPLSES